MNTDPISGSNPNTNPSNNFVQNPKNNDTNIFLVSTVLNGNENNLQWKFSIQIALGAKKTTKQRVILLSY